jgi:hypothetical protein
MDLSDGMSPEQELAQFNAFVADASEPLAWLYLGAKPVAQSVRAGTTAAYSVIAAQHGLPAEPVTLALAGQPPETRAQFEPNPILPPGDSRLWITTMAATGAGTYPLTVTGTTGSMTATLALTMTIVPPHAGLSPVAYLPLVVDGQ